MSSSAILLASVGSGVLIQLLGALTGVILARSLGAAARGELAAAMVVPTLVAGLSTLGLVDAVTFHGARQTWPRDRILGTAIAFLLLLSLAGIVAGLVINIGLLRQQSELTGLWSDGYLVFIPVSAVCLALMADLSGRHDFTPFFVARVLVAVAGAVLLATAAVLGGLSVPVALGTYIAANVVTLGYLLWVFRRRVVTIRLEPSIARPLAAYGLKTHAGTVVALLSSSLPQLVLAARAEPSALGMYAVCLSLTSVVTLIGYSIGVVLLPLHAAGTVSFVSSRRGSLLLAAVASGACALPIVLWTEFVLGGLFGPQFAAAALAARIMMLGAVAASVGRVASVLLRAEDRPGDASLAQIAALGAAAVTLVVLAASPLYAAALAFSLAGMAMTAYSLASLARHR